MSPLEAIKARLRDCSTGEFGESLGGDSPAEDRAYDRGFYDAISRAEDIVESELAEPRTAQPVRIVNYPPTRISAGADVLVRVPDVDALDPKKHYRFELRFFEVDDAGKDVVR